MAIGCGCCGGVHDTLAEVRACCAGQPPEPAPRPAVAPGPGAPASPAGVDPPPCPPRPAAAWAGPPALARGLLVTAGAEAPAPWDAAPRLLLDDRAAGAPEALVAEVRRRLAAGERVVVELATALPTSGQRLHDPAHELGPRVEPALDALAHLLRWRFVDGRAPEAATWAPAGLALAAGALPAPPDSDADVLLPDGTPAWCDGELLRHVEGLAHPVLPRVLLDGGVLRPLGPNRTTADLAPDQLAAVTHAGGSARIIAPAGSGKTRVLTERARLLVQGWGVPASSVCLVAYNRRAQQEMEARLADVRGLRVRTLNALALEVLQGRPPFAPQPERVRTIDEPEVRRMLSALVKLPRRANTDPAAAWIEAFGVARLGLVDPAEVERRYAQDCPGFADVLRRYRAALRSRSLVDFDEQVLQAVELLLASPVAREHARRACGVLLVDEFQDLRPAHLLLVRLLAGPDLAVVGVGDDDQTIYGYNGADPAWLIDFPALFPGAGDHPLEVNYRCPATVVDAADHLVRHNRRRVAKVIRSASPPPPGGWSVRQGPDTVSATVAAVREAVDGGRVPASCAVLTRVNDLLVPVAVGLRSAGVPVRTDDTGAGFLGRAAVRASLAWLRLAADPDHLDPDDLAEAARRPSRGLSERLRGWLAEQRDLAGVQRLAGRLNDAKDTDKLLAFVDDVQLLAGLVSGRHPRRGSRGGGGRPATTPEVLDALVEHVGLGGSISRLDDSRRGMNQASQADDLEALRQLARLQPDPLAFPGWLGEQLRAPSDPHGVTLATVHRVKGQEWPFVVVHHVDAQQFPHRLSEDVEEERRVFHVAVTRTSAELVVVATPTVSPFVAELTAEPPPPGSPEPSRLVRSSPAAGRAAPAGPARTTPEVPLDADGEALLAVLKDLRRLLADGKPAYVVATDLTLRQVAAARPRSTEDLLRVPGMGPKKVELYGAAILAAVAAVLDEEP